MAVYQRFQILSSAQQNLLLPDSPVWVSRYQISRDTQSGKCLLQTRMVNCSEKTVRQVFLRIVCYDAGRERLAQLELVPVQTQQARPGMVFGDDGLVEIAVKGTVFAEVFAQRVRFSDASAWDETHPERYLAFPPPEPVRAEDPHYEILASRALSGGVQNDYYFRAQQGLWLCTCGLPNAGRVRCCARCGADRLWLERQMDRNLLDAPAPRPAALGAAPPLADLVPLRQEPRPSVPPTIILQPAPNAAAALPSAPHGAGSGRAGRVAAIAAAAVLGLCVIGFSAVHFLSPYLRYREALREQAGGNYDQAVAIFRELGEYKDSVGQIQQTLAQKAYHMMSENQFQQALELLETLEGYDDYKQDCIYALGALAFNDSELDQAMRYISQLEQRNPSYDKLPELKNRCLSALGERESAAAAEQADPAARIAQYEQAIDYFEQSGLPAGGEQISVCRYRIAEARQQSGELLEAISAFAALKDFQDADTRRRDCMMQYARQHVENTDETTMDFLTELANDGDADANALLERLNGQGFYFDLSYGPVPENGKVQTVYDLSYLYIHYKVDQRDENGAVLVLVLYSLPDGRSGRALLNNDRSADGSRCWGEIPFPVNCSTAGDVSLSFYDSMRGEGVEPLERITFAFSPDAANAPNAAGDPRTAKDAANASRPAKDSTKDSAKDAAKDNAKDTAKDSAKDSSKDTEKDTAKESEKDTEKDTEKESADDPAPSEGISIEFGSAPADREAGRR